MGLFIYIDDRDRVESAANLVGNPGTNISGSTDVVCQSWQLSYKHFTDQFPSKSINPTDTE